MGVIQGTSQNAWQQNQLVQFIDWILRGVGQVMLQNNPVTGLFFLVGISVGSYVAGIYALLGTIVATLTALALGVSRNVIKEGLHGFNGALLGIGMAVFMKQSLILPIYVIVAAMFVTIVTTALQAILAGKRISTLTAPFVLTTWIFLEAAYNFGHLFNTSALNPPALARGAMVVNNTLSFGGVVTAFLNGIAQVMLQQNIWTGILFLIGILINSRISFVAAIVGSLIGVLVAWILGVPGGTIQAGLYSYDAVLTAIALGGMLYILSGASILITIFAAIITVIMHGTLTAALTPLGLPALTSAFVLTTWLCLLGKDAFANLEEAFYGHIGTPERHLKHKRAVESQSTG